MTFKIGDEVYVVNSYLKTTFSKKDIKKLIRKLKIVNKSQDPRNDYYKCGSIYNDPNITYDPYETTTYPRYIFITYSEALIFLQKELINLLSSYKSMYEKRIKNLDKSFNYCLTITNTPEPEWDK